MNKKYMAFAMSILLTVSSLMINFTQAASPNFPDINEEAVLGDDDEIIATPSNAAGTFRSAEVATPADAYEITFVARDNEKTVKFSSLDDLLNITDEDGNKGDTSDKGGGTSKAYFLFWSNIQGYNGSEGQIDSGAKAFYSDEPLANAYEALTDNKLYAVYMDGTTAMYFADKIKGKISINNNISYSEIMYDNFVVKGNENDENNHSETTSFYIPNDISEYSNIQLGAEFKLSPYINAFVRYSPSHFYQPGTAQYYGNRGPRQDNQFVEDRVSTSDDPAVTQYTFVDLKVEIDERIKLNDELNFTFRGYAFKPLMILSEDRNKLDADITINPSDPDCHISFNPNGNNTFIIRTVMRGREEIPEPSFEDSNLEDMRIITDREDNFKVSKEELIKIARGEAPKLEIKGQITGGMFLYKTSFWIMTVGGPKRIPTHTANVKLLDYRFNYVNFDKNSTSLSDSAEQNLGRTEVIHASSIDSDILVGTLTEANLLGTDMPDNPESFEANGETYDFIGWNTRADGTGETFTKDSIVNEDITVYAQWRAHVVEVTTEWESETGEALKPMVTDTEMREHGDIAGYTFVRTDTTATGFKHIFRQQPVRREVTTEWESETGEVLKPMVTDTEMREYGDIAGYTFVRTDTTATGFKHIFRQQPVRREVTTEWESETGEVLKPMVTDTAMREHGDIAGYTFVRTDTTATGFKHIFRQQPVRREVTTEWESETGEVLKPMVTDTYMHQHGSVARYIFVRTDTTATGFKHIFKKVQNSGGNDGHIGGGNSSTGGGGGSHRPNISISNGGPGVNIPSNNANITPAPIVPDKPVQNSNTNIFNNRVPKTSDDNMVWQFAVIAVVAALGLVFTFKNMSKHDRRRHNRRRKK